MEHLSITSSPFCCPSKKWSNIVAHEISRYDEPLRSVSPDVGVACSGCVATFRLFVVGGSPSFSILGFGRLFSPIKRASLRLGDFGSFRAAALIASSPRLCCEVLGRGVSYDEDRDRDLDLDWSIILLVSSI